jgi:hypothetical protein
VCDTGWVMVRVSGARVMRTLAGIVVMSLVCRVS